MSDDLISRQAAIDDIARWIGYLDEDMIYRIQIGLKKLQPGRKRGKWIKMSDADGVYWSCSECGEALPRVEDFDPQFDLFPRLKSIEKTKFCPDCGAQMDERNEE